MSKVAIIGNAGGGKSILARKLSQAKRLPLHAVDKYQWRPRWTPAPEGGVRDSLNSLLAADRWIIDGWGPWDCIERRLDAADTIVFVDHPLWVHLWWAAKRQVRALLAPWTLDKPEGCNLLPVTLRMFRTIRTIHQTATPSMRELVASHAGSKDVFHIRSPRDLRRFVSVHC